MSPPCTPRRTRDTATTSRRRRRTAAHFAALPGAALRRLSFFLVSVVALVAGPALAAPVAFVGATLIDGTGAAPLADAVVVIDGERIVAVGRVPDVVVPPGAERVDAAGKWLLPGFIDAHVHFFQSGGAFARPDILDLRRLKPYAREVAEVRANVPATLARTLAAGITSVVDVGGPYWTFDVRDAAATLARAPRVAVAGPLLTPYFPPELAVDDPPMMQIDTPAQARTEVRRLAARRPDLIKIWFVRAGLNMQPQLNWMRAAIEEAHAANIPVAVHATELRTARAVVELGADLLVHGVSDQVVDAQFLFLLQARGIAYTPTLAVVENYDRVLGLAFQPTPLEERLGDPAVIRSLLDLARLPPAERPRALRNAAVRPIDPDSAANLRRARDAGVLLAAGSDAGNIGTLPGAGFHRELELMVQAGLSPMEALIAATRGGAALLRRTDQLGTVTPGKLADLVLLDADPLADIRNTARIWRVVRGGVVHDPAAILSSLGR